MPKNTSINIKEGTISITQGAFYDCTGLTTVNFYAKNCSYMGSDIARVFSGCTNLTTLNIGENVENIPRYAFRDCDKIENVYTYPIIPPIIYDDTFSPHTNYIASLHIVRGCKNAYTQAEYWNYFSDITDDLTSVEGVEADDTFSVAVVGGTLTITGTADDADVNIYNTNGSLLHHTTATQASGITLSSGIYLVQVNGVTKKVAL